MLMSIEEALAVRPPYSKAVPVDSFALKKDLNSESFEGRHPTPIEIGG